MSQVIKGVGILHTPQFSVHGSARKKLVKERNLLRSCLRTFKWYVGINNDLYSIYGPEHMVKSEEWQENRMKELQVELDDINKRLQEAYKES